MIGFIGTSLQLQSIMIAHILNSFWMPYVWRNSPKNLSLLGLIPTTTTTTTTTNTNTAAAAAAAATTTTRIHECTAFCNYHAARIEVTISNSLCYSVFPLPGNTLWFLQAYSLLREQVPTKRLLAKLLPFLLLFRLLGSVYLAVA
jgi:hypothetical protein